MNNVIAVIGAGNGGTAIAAHMASLGGNVALCDLFPQYLTEIQEKGYIELTCEGKTQRVSMPFVTNDVSQAVKDAKLIMVVTPAFTHKKIAEACWQSLTDGQIIVLNPGRTGGALEFKETLAKCGCKAHVVIAETQTLIYSCRKTDGNAVTIFGIKKAVDISAFPATKTNEVVEALFPYYPQFTPRKNGLCTSLCNIGSMFHPTPILLNIGRIENDKRGYRYYIDGITPSVAALIEKLDSERIEVANAYGINVLTAVQWLKRSYETYGNTLYELIQNNKAYMDIMAPKTIDARYMTEDVPSGLVPIAALGDAAGVATPNIDAVITLAGSIYNKDFFYEGRSLKNLGIDNMTKDEIISYFETGVGINRN